MKKRTRPRPEKASGKQEDTVEELGRVYQNRMTSVVFNALSVSR